MSDRCSLDTNVILYAPDASDGEVADTARRLVAARPVISTQVRGEAANLMLRKLRVTPERVGRHLRLLLRRCLVSVAVPAHYLRAVELHRQYGFPYWDSLVIASALEAGWAALYSQDLQHGQVFESRLRVLNPFATHGTIS